MLLPPGGLKSAKNNSCKPCVPMFWKKLKNSKTWELQLLSDNFNWNSHIDIIVSKANRMLGLIKRTCRGLDDTKTLRTLYCALVRSNIEYCSVVWSPYTKRNIEKVEKVQRRATKFILKTEDNYETRLKKLNLMSLKNRRFLADVIF